MKRLCGFTVLVVFALVLFSAGAALGAPDLEVTCNGDRVDDGDDLLVSEKTVNVSVYDQDGETNSLLINGKTAATVAGKVYTWSKNISLVPGVNKIAIEAKWSGGSSEEFTFYVKRADTPVPGLSYHVPSLPASGKLEGLNKAFVLTYSSSVLVDEDGDIVDDQGVDFEICSAPSDPDERRPDGYHLLASPNFPYVLRIQPEDPDARFVRTGQLTLPYDQNISATQADRLAIWYSPDNDWNDSDNVNLGGYTDPGKHTVTASLPLSGEWKGYYAVFLSQREFLEFTDPAGSAMSWAYSPVVCLYAKGIAEPNDQGPVPLERNRRKVISAGWFGLKNDDNTQKSITRLEFVTMMVKGLGFPLLEKPGRYEEVFRDVRSWDEPSDSNYFGQYYPGSNYYKPSLVQYVETAARNGIVSGYPDGTFGPMRSLTRQEAAVILARVAGLKLPDDDQKTVQDLQRTFGDSGAIASWAAPSVYAAQKAKLIVGMPDPNSQKIVFKPDAPLSRAEAISLAYRLLKKLKKI